MRFFSTIVASIIGTFIALGLFTLFGLVLLAGLAAVDSGAPPVRQGSVLVVNLNTDLPEVEDTEAIPFLLTGGRALTLADATRAIRHAADDDRIAALWITARSARSSWAALEEIRSAVEVFRASGKPTLATSDADGFSERDYFVASAAEYVYSPSQALFELNGFALVAQFLKGLLDKVDVKVEAIRAGTYKSAVEPFTRTNLSEANRAQLESILGSQAGIFASSIAESRGISEDEIAGWVASSSIQTAEQARLAGLIDGLATDDEVRTIIADSLLLTDDEPPFVSIRNYARSVPAGTSRDVVAVLYASGTIVDGGSGYDPNPLFGGKAVGANDLVRMLREIRDDEQIKAVVLRIDSPGGVAQAADVIADAIRETAAIKPLVASLGDVAASGGYYIAAPADWIVADRSTLTGSIGVFSLLINTSGLMENKLGVTFDAVKTGPTADMFSGVRALTDFEKAILQHRVEQTYDRFTSIVAEGRDMSKEQVLSLAEGRVWTGEQALQNGLVDEAGTLEDAIAAAARLSGVDSTGYRLSTYPEAKSLVEKIWQLSPEIRLWSHPNPASETLVEQIRLLTEIGDMHGEVQALMPLRFSIK